MSVLYSNVKHRSSPVITVSKWASLHSGLNSKAMPCISNQPGDREEGAAGDRGSLMESEINSRKGVKGLKGCQVELIPTPTPRTCALHTGADGPGDKCLLAKSLTFIKLLSEGRAGR